MKVKKCLPPSVTTWPHKARGGQTSYRGDKKNRCLYSAPPPPTGKNLYGTGGIRMDTIRIGLCYLSLSEYYL